MAKQMVHRVLSVLVAAIGLSVFLVFMNASIDLIAPRAVAAVPVPASVQGGMVYGEATLDTSQIVDSRPTSAQQDATAEGRDVLIVAYGPAPAELWSALSTDHLEWYDDQGTNGYGAFMVPIGAVVDVPDGHYVATYDGWSISSDDATSACWVEHKVGLPDEVIQGDPSLMPAGSTPIDCATIN